MSKTTITGQKVIISPIKPSLAGELADKIYYECRFCGKNVGLYTDQRRVLEKLSGCGEFYCHFCLRHNLHNRNNKHILTMSFRSIIGYYYFDKYRYATKKELYLSEIGDFVKSHVRAGLINPVFLYDPETYLWFIDFNRVGKGRKKIRLGEVLKTVSSILACFNITEHCTTVKLADVYEKYKEAIEKFYSQRYRPEERRHLIPTLHGTGVVDTNKKFDFERTRMFTPEGLVA